MTLQRPWPTSSNEQSLAYASGAAATYPLVAKDGGKEALLAYADEFTPGSDHVVLTEGAFRIPSVYLNDWPDRYIHTDRDLPANIDPTKLERAAFIGASTGWYLANLAGADTDDLLGVVNQKRLVRTARMLGRGVTLGSDEAAVLQRFHWDYERELLDSIGRFAPLTPAQRDTAARQIDELSRLYGDGGVAPDSRGATAIVYTRNENPKGPMSVFGYDYLVDHLGKSKADALALPNYTGLRAEGEFVRARGAQLRRRQALGADDPRSHSPRSSGRFRSSTSSSISRRWRRSACCTASSHHWPFARYSRSSKLITQRGR